ncbi:MAG: hypothetical protein DSM106950_36975 [Stigonema ocellatum SAG 48.90 = DSM 106950]|nr:hypothetical protein [Stigonema ocellatum SAG 48.90 = DSM 106950]
MQYGYQVSQNHGVYQLCGSMSRNQPTTVAMNAQRVYDTLCSRTKLINAKIDAGGKATTLFLDKHLLAVGLVERDEKGRYAIAPLANFVGL